VPSTGYLLAVLATILVITFALRALPFAVLEPLRGSALMGSLSRWMPAGIMTILVVYTLKDVSLGTGWHGLPEALALAVTVGLHVWRRNALLSILGGTAVYVLLVNTVLATPTA
jgi:branched-subunit amino acid transport protein AzlD